MVRHAPGWSDPALLGPLSPVGTQAYAWCNRKLNTSPAKLDDKEVLKKPLCFPKVKKIDLHFPLGLEVTARNLKGVTIKDALDAIYKKYAKKVCLCFHLTLLPSRQPITPCCCLGQPVARPPVTHLLPLNIVSYPGLTMSPG